jgi:hypothetical protein
MNTNQSHWSTDLECAWRNALEFRLTDLLIGSIGSNQQAAEWTK